MLIQSIILLLHTMLKKYVPYILLLIAAFAILYIKTHQRGHFTTVPIETENTRVNDTIAAVVNSDSADGDLNRTPSRIIYSRHAKCRMDCRHIDEAEVKEILKEGKVNERKIEEDSRGTTYPLEGTAEGHHLRIVFAPKGNDAVEVVTCIDLDTDWKCDCE
jgi:hypothetical protein